MKRRLEKEDILQLMEEHGIKLESSQVQGFADSFIEQFGKSNDRINLHIGEIGQLVGRKLLNRGNLEKKDEKQLTNLVSQFWQSLKKVVNCEKNDNSKNKGIKSIYKHEFVRKIEAEAFEMIPLLDRESTIEQFLKYCQSCAEAHYDVFRSHGDIELCVVEGCSGLGKSRFVHELLKQDSNDEMKDATEFQRLKDDCFNSLKKGNGEVVRIGITYDNSSQSHATENDPINEFCWRIIYEAARASGMTSNLSSFISKTKEDFSDWDELNDLATTLAILYGLDGIDKSSPFIIAVDEILNATKSVEIKEKNDKGDKTDKIKVSGWKGILSAIGDFYDVWTKAYPSCLFLITSLDGSGFDTTTSSNRLIRCLTLELLSHDNMMHCIKSLAVIKSIEEDKSIPQTTFDKLIICLEFLVGLTNGFAAQFFGLLRGLLSIEKSRLKSNDVDWALDSIMKTIATAMDEDFQHRYENLGMHLNDKNYLCLIELTGYPIDESKMGKQSYRKEAMTLSEYNGGVSVSIQDIFLKGMARNMGDRLVFPSLMLLHSVATEPFEACSTSTNKEKDKSNDNASECYSGGAPKKKRRKMGYHGSCTQRKAIDNDNSNDNSNEKKIDNGTDNDKVPKLDRENLKLYLEQLFQVPHSLKELGGIEYERRIKAMAIVKSWQYKQGKCKYGNNNVTGNECKLIDYFGKEFSFKGSKFAERAKNACIFPHLFGSDTTKTSDMVEFEAGKIYCGEKSNMKGVDIIMLVYDKTLKDWFRLFIQSKTATMQLKNWDAKNVNSVLTKMNECFKYDTDLGVVMSIREPPGNFKFNPDGDDGNRIGWVSRKGQDNFFGPQFNHIHRWVVNTAKANENS